MIYNIAGVGGVKFALKSFESDKSVSPQLARGSYEPHIQFFLREILQKHQDVSLLDIGANLGQHAIYAKKLGYTKITCIEASAKSCECIKESIELNSLSDIHVENVVLSDEVKDVDYFFWEENAACAFVADSNYGDTNHPAHKSKQRSVVLSDVVQPDYDVVKIDIEGSEHLVLDSSPEIFREAKYVIIEVNNFTSNKFFNYNASENLGRLKSMGFDGFLVFDGNNSWQNIAYEHAIEIADKSVMRDFILYKNNI